ncbi:hypothetical protein [Bacteriovorax sp. DB6_IX]|uniref:hypothetical protein n=1 Tax=Bacteriovorax sp. DB6_IX TaxID=1353530 RepID=UPI0018DF9670|nr:hypothetical protein [Bacteriovorax sp. DB6_IX]
MRYLRVPLAILLLLSVTEATANSYQTELRFAREVKGQIEETLDKGKLRYEYDPKKNIRIVWRDREISPADYANLMKAYNIAHDIERKVRLQNELKSQDFRHTEFPERKGPSYPLVEKQTAPPK